MGQRESETKFRAAGLRVGPTPTFSPAGDRASLRVTRVPDEAAVPARPLLPPPVGPQFPFLLGEFGRETCTIDALGCLQLCPHLCLGPAPGAHLPLCLVGVKCSADANTQ